MQGGPLLAAWDVVAAPFPYVERPVMARRPVLTLSHSFMPIPDVSLVWVMMITSQDNPGWEGDIPIQELAVTGLRHASVVRTAKLATIETRDLKSLGTLSKADRSAVRRCIVHRYLGVVS